jgi:hypothetical protein
MWHVWMPKIAAPNEAGARHSDPNCAVVSGVAIWPQINGGTGLVPRYTGRRYDQWAIAGSQCSLELW